MSIRIVRLGTPRHPDEGVRIGTVRRPPRGVPKSEHAARDFYDTWLPELAPTPELMKLGKAVESDEDWKAFAKKYRAEMAAPEKSRLLDLVDRFAAVRRLLLRERDSLSPFPAPGALEGARRGP